MMFADWTATKTGHDVQNLEQLYDRLERCRDQG